jgi:hypothetical protein
MNQHLRGPWWTSRNSSISKIREVLLSAYYLRKVKLLFSVILCVLLLLPNLELYWSPMVEFLSKIRFRRSDRLLKWDFDFNRYTEIFSRIICGTMNYPAERHAFPQYASRKVSVVYSAESFDFPIITQIIRGNSNFVHEYLCEFAKKY